MIQTHACQSPAAEAKLAQKRLMRYDSCMRLPIIPITPILINNFSALCSKKDTAGLRELLIYLDSIDIDPRWPSALLRIALDRASIDGLNALAPRLTRFDFNQRDDNLLALVLLRPSTANPALADARLQQDVEMAELIGRLVELGVNPNGPKNKPPTPLALALRRNPGVAFALIAHGAIPTPEDMRQATLIQSHEVLARMLKVRSGPPSLVMELESLARGKKSADCLAVIIAVRERQELRDVAPGLAAARTPTSRRI